MKEHEGITPQREREREVVHLSRPNKGLNNQNTRDKHTQRKLIVVFFRKEFLFIHNFFSHFFCQTGWFGLWGKKVDAIEYYSSEVEKLSQQVSHQTELFQ